MYIYDYFLKDKTRWKFYADGPFIPDEVDDFVSKHKDEIESSFCDHYSYLTVASFLGDQKLTKYEVVCKPIEEEED